jgi:hypothetical protein
VPREQAWPMLSMCPCFAWVLRPQHLHMIVLQDWQLSMLAQVWVQAAMLELVLLAAGKLAAKWGSPGTRR